jgi:hypothetical protein
MKRIALALLLALSSPRALPAQRSPQIDLLFRSSYAVFELQRLPNGMYRDAKRFQGADYHPISISNTGMGLIALCIADSMGWIGNARQLALATLKAATGHAPGFLPDRNANGYFRHFMNVQTGAREWNSEYSTIDTDILVCGALFCMKYFRDEEITQYARELYRSINFSAAIANPSTGKIYLSMNADGSGVSNALTSPYNEYMIAAWLAKHYHDVPGSPGALLWERHYQDPEALPTALYEGHEVLSDRPGGFLSSFTHQFNYYLCHFFASSQAYRAYFENARKADSAWWALSSSPAHAWGLGAGSAISTPYHADAINDNPDSIVSPHIIAGYLPVYPGGKGDLIRLWDEGQGKYALPNAYGDPILWRYSPSRPGWQPNEIIGVDHASMLFGLASLPEYLGAAFFSAHNDFFPLSWPQPPLDSLPQGLRFFPNPARELLCIETGPGVESIGVSLRSLDGRSVYEARLPTSGEVSIPLGMAGGLYLLTLDSGSGPQHYKLVKE